MFDIASSCALDSGIEYYIVIGQHRYRVLALDEEAFLEATKDPNDPDDDNSTLLGQCDTITNTIYLRTHYNGTKRAESKLRVTLLHEAIHVAWEYVGLDAECEEAIVRSLAPALLDLLADSVWLTSVIDSVDNDGSAVIQDTKTAGEGE